MSSEVSVIYAVTCGNIVSLFTRQVGGVVETCGCTVDEGDPGRQRIFDDDVVPWDITVLPADKVIPLVAGHYICSLHPEAPALRTSFLSVNVALRCKLRFT